MALINPASLYSGGNVRFDNTPYLRMAMQQRARKQALDEASTQYFTKLAEKLNPAGVRPQDMEDPEGNGGIQADIDSWQEKWNLNKDAIKRGGIAQQEFMADFNKIKQKISMSKERDKAQAQMGKSTLSGQWSPDEEDLPIVAAIDASIYSKKSRKADGVSMWGLNDLSMSAKPYTPDYQMKHDKVISAEIQPGKLPGDNGVFNPDAMTVTYNYGYTPEQASQIVQNGLGTLKSDRTMRRAMREALKDPKQTEIASRYLQEERDRTIKDGQIVVADTIEEMYAGLQLAKFRTASVPKTLSDKASINEWNQAEFDRRSNRREGFQREMFKKREAGKNARAAAIINQYEIPDVFDAVSKQPTIKVKWGGVDEEFVDISNLSAAEKDDLLGKESGKFNQRDYRPVSTGDKLYIKKKDGVLVDADNQPFDADATFGKTFSRLKGSKEAQAKGKATKGTSTVPKKRKFD